MSNSITGTLHKVLPQESGTGKNDKKWFKQSFVIKTNGQYPKEVCITAWGDKCDLIPQKPGTEVTVYFDPESREYNGKYYTELKFWKAESGKSEPVSKVTGQSIPASNEDEDLPF